MGAEHRTEVSASSKLFGNLELIMYYVCIESNKVISVLNYEPNVPVSVTVISITDAEEAQITQQTHYFDVDTRTVKSVAASVAEQKAQQLANSKEREFLNSTDWKILRHMRQKALNIDTSLSEAEYIQLEQQRQSAAARII
jgi:hypothetical protein